MKVWVVHISEVGILEEEPEDSSYDNSGNDEAKHERDGLGNESKNEESQQES